MSKDITQNQNNQLTLEERKQFNLLMDAVQAGNIEAVNAMINTTPKLIHAQDENGFTLLMTAACFNNGAEIINLLIKKDPNIARAKDKNGWTALMYAAYSDDVNKVTAIIKAAKDMINACDKEGMNALMIAACGKNHSEVVKSLIQNGAFYLVTKSGWTALTYALCNGNTKVAKILIKIDYQLPSILVKDLENSPWLVYRDKMLKIAMICCINALITNPNNPLSYNGIGIVHYLQGAFKKAIYCFNKAIKFDTSRSHYSFLTNRGLTYEKLGEIENANKDFEQAKTIQPDLKHVYLQNALCYEQSSDYNFAIEFYNIALRFDPLSEEIKNKIAELARKSSDVGDEKVAQPASISSCVDQPQLILPPIIEEYYK